MFEINSETFYRMAHEYHRNQLAKSKTARMIESANSYTPRVWDHVSLRVGNWLIELGRELKSRSVFSQLSGNQA